MKRITVSFVLLISLVVGSNSFADIKVYDANNQFLGYLITLFHGGMGFGDYYFIYNRQLSSIIPLTSEASKPFTYATVQSILYFSNPACEGNAYYSTQFSSLLSTSFTFKTNINHYKTHGGPLSVSYLSKYDPVTKECTNISGTTTAIRAEKVNLPFSIPILAPFRLEQESSGQTKAVVIPMMN